MNYDIKTLALGILGGRKLTMGTKGEILQAFSLLGIAAFASQAFDELESCGYEGYYHLSV